MKPILLSILIAWVWGCNCYGQKEAPIPQRNLKLNRGVVTWDSFGIRARQDSIWRHNRDSLLGLVHSYDSAPHKNYKEEKVWLIGNPADSMWKANHKNKKLVTNKNNHK